MCTSRISDKSEAYARSDESSSCSACWRFVIGVCGAGASDEDEDDVASSSIDSGESGRGGRLFDVVARGSTGAGRLRWRIRKESGIVSPTIVA